MQRVVRYRKKTAKLTQAAAGSRAEQAMVPQARAILQPYTTCYTAAIHHRRCSTSASKSIQSCAVQYTREIQAHNTRVPLLAVG